MTADREIPSPDQAAPGARHPDAAASRPPSNASATTENTGLAGTEGVDSEPGGTGSAPIEALNPAEATRDASGKAANAAGSGSQGRAASATAPAGEYEQEAMDSLSNPPATAGLHTGNDEPAPDQKS